MFDWCQIHTITIDAVVTEVRYSHTPEEFIDEMKARHQTLTVANKACSECVYVPGGRISQTDTRSMTDDALAFHRYPECVCSAIARRMRAPDVPDFVICYGFYYQYWHRNKYLLAAKEAGLVTFCDVSSYPGFKESGLESYAPYFY